MPRSICRPGRLAEAAAVRAQPGRAVVAWLFSPWFGLPLTFAGEPVAGTGHATALSPLHDQTPLKQGRQDWGFRERVRMA